MAAIPVLNRNATAKTTVTPLDLSGGPHTWTNAQGIFDLVVDNGESGAVTINILGAGVTTHDCANVGEIDLSAGYDLSCAAGEVTNLSMGQISAYFGAIGNEVTFTVTGATGQSTAYLVRTN